MPIAENSETLATQIRQLGHLLGETIVRLEGKETFELEERIRLLAKRSRSGDAAAEGELESLVKGLSVAEASRIARAFTVYFELVNLAEESQRIRILRQRRRAHYQEGSAPLRESIGAALRELKERQVPAERVQALLDQLKIELVFTAHPTESKRRTLLNKLQRVSARLLHPERPSEDEISGSPEPRAMERELTSLWLTDRSRAARPEVTDEVRTGLWYFETVLWKTVPLLQDELERALAETYPGLRAPTRWLKFGSWMGGDRDGNPNVTPEVTAETLLLHRGLALEKVQSSLRGLARLLSISSRLDGISPEIQAEIAQIPAEPEAHAQRYPQEPYRHLLSQMRSELLTAQKEEKSAWLLDSEATPSGKVIQTGAVARLLDLIQDSLEHNRAEVLAGGELRRLQQQLTLFGLSVARLDVRQHSGRHETAVAEIMRQLQLTPDYLALEETGRVELLSRQWNQAPLRPDSAPLSPEARDVVGSLRVLKQARQLFGEESVGAYVISMTHDLSDVLEVLWLQRMVGVELDVAPLFETLGDLEAAPAILEQMFSSPVYRAHLQRRHNHQMIMLGYSDSNKDCGYLTANWALFQAQEEIARVCRRQKIGLTLFHGRGGSIARGGGPAAKAILAQPCGLTNASIRVTEQGEVLSTRYHDPDLAFRIIEQMTYGVLLGAEAAQTEAVIPETWRAAMTEMSRLAYRAYYALVHNNPEFIEFWRIATPIEEISGLKLGSRPTFRKATKSVEDLRAIPWVFSWMQSRFVFPGWYGLGSALTQFAARGATEQALLQTIYRDWMFFRATIDNAQLTLLKADRRIAARYAALVPDEAIRTRIFREITEEFSRTEQAILEITGQKALLEGEPVLARSVQLRNPYIDPLNYIEVEMIARLRRLEDKQSAEAAEIRSVIELAINGVSSGLKNTG